MIEKRITKEDIISLGWINIEDNIYNLSGKESLILGREPHLEVSAEEILITLGYASYHGVVQGIIFKGKLITDNPKEELETIMKQVGIV